MLAAKGSSHHVNAQSRQAIRSKVKGAALLVRSRSAALIVLRLLDQKMTAPHTRAGMRGGCSPQNNRLSKRASSRWQQISLGFIRTVAEESFVEVRRAVSCSNGAALAASRCIPDGFGGDFALAVLSIRANSIVVCVARQSRCFTKWQRCRITNHLRGGRLRQCFGKLETLLRGSVCVTEFIPMRFRICRS